MSRFADTLDRLQAVIAARKGADPGSSYTAKLLGEGPERLAKKFGDKDALAAESADVIYHWLVLLAAAGVSLDQVAAKLEAREGTSGLAEKASRSS